MGITRRQFLLAGTALGAGLIVPSFFKQAAAFVEQCGEALLVPPKEIITDMFAIDRGDYEYQLNLGNPYTEPPILSWREYFATYGDDPLEYFDVANESEIEERIGIGLDDEADWFVVVDSWARSESPNSRAYRLLEGLDLGTELSGADAVGEIRFIDGACPGVDYLGVHAPDDLSLSLLQHRLNQLGTGIRIQIVT